jgi:hypothetical protein
VTFVNSPDIRSWSVTSRITSLRFGGGNIHLEHTKLGQWPPVVIAPDGTTQESTLWVFFRINGQWNAAGGERFRPGQTDKALTRPSDIGPGWFYNASWGPMYRYTPKTGEQVGFMIAAGQTRAGGTGGSVPERSDILMIPFPSDRDGGSFP